MSFVSAIMLINNNKRNTTPEQNPCLLWYHVIELNKIQHHHTIVEKKALSTIPCEQIKDIEKLKDRQMGKI